MVRDGTVARLECIATAWKRLKEGSRARCVVPVAGVPSPEQQLPGTHPCCPIAMLKHLSLAAALLGPLCNAVPAADLPLSEPVVAERIDSREASANTTYWRPPMKSKIQFILTGIPNVDDGFIKPDTGIYEIDMFFTPAATIRKMNELGQKTICYFSAATAENWRDDYKQFDKKDLGKSLPDWPGEKYLDIRRDNVFKVIKKRIDLAAQKGCNAIEPDNVGM